MVTKPATTTKAASTKDTKDTKDTKAKVQE